MERASRRHEDAGRLSIHERDRTVLHLGGGVALGVDVADLLELQSPLERDREVKVAAQEQGTSSRCDRLGGRLDQRLQLEDFTQ